MPLRKLLYSTITLTYVLFTVLRFGFPFLLAAEINSTTLVEEANSERIKRDIHPLRYNKKLELAAFEKADDMLKKQYWAHFGPNNETPWQFITSTGYTYAFAGENLAKGFFDSTAIHDAWMNSPTHRENILQPSFDEVGIAVVKGNLQGADVYLVVEMFGSTEYRSPANANLKDYPYVKISSPVEGDILKDGIFTVKGEGKHLKNDQVSVLLNTELLGTTSSEDTQFVYQAESNVPSGDVKITAKGVGVGDEYLADSVNVKVVSNTSSTLKDLKSCINIAESTQSVDVSYTCTDKSKLLSMNVQIGSTKYTNAKDKVDLVRIDKTSLPKTDLTLNITLELEKDGEHFIQEQYTVKSIPAQVFAAANLGNQFSLGIIFIVIGVVLFILLAIAIVMSVRKRSFSAHKKEFIAMGIAILLVVLISQSKIIHV